MRGRSRRSTSGCLSDARDFERLKLGFRTGASLLTHERVAGKAGPAFPTSYSARVAAIGRSGRVQHAAARAVCRNARLCRAAPLGADPERRDARDDARPSARGRQRPRRLHRRVSRRRLACVGDVPDGAGGRSAGGDGKLRSRQRHCRAADLRRIADAEHPAGEHQHADDHDRGADRRSGEGRAALASALGDVAPAAGRLDRRAHRVGAFDRVGRNADAEDLLAGLGHRLDLGRGIAEDAAPAGLCGIERAFGLGAVGELGEMDESHGAVARGRRVLDEDFDRHVGPDVGEADGAADVDVPLDDLGRREDVHLFGRRAQHVRDDRLLDAIAGRGRRECRTASSGRYTRSATSV